MTSRCSVHGRGKMLRQRRSRAGGRNSIGRMRRPRSVLPPSVRVDTDVGELLLPASDQLMRIGLARDGVWEPREGAVLRELVSPGMAALDVGAHCGYFTLMLAHLVGEKGEVVAIEPEPD